MIILTIDLIELPENERQEQIENIEQNFPYIGDDPDELTHSLGEDTSITVQLYQKVLTNEQMDFLDRNEYVREYKTREGAMYDKPTASTLEPWQVEAIQDILANQITKVPSNGNHTRYYTEPLAERQWDNEHHLIDIEGKEPMYGKLTITQCSTSDPVQVVKLSYNEVDELLTALLQWRMDAARASHETATKVNDDILSDLDDRPF